MVFFSNAMAFNANSRAKMEYTTPNSKNSTVKTKNIMIGDNSQIVEITGVPAPVSFYYGLFHLNNGLFHLRHGVFTPGVVFFAFRMMLVIFAAVFVALSIMLSRSSMLPVARAMVFYGFNMAILRFIMMFFIFGIVFIECILMLFISSKALFTFP